MSWKEKRLITILSIILAVLCAAVLVVLSIRYRAAQGSLLAFTRSAEGETILAAFNTGGESAELRLEDAERIELLLGSARFQISAQGHVLTLPPRTGSLLKLSVSGDALQEPD